jgi:hypothetical protein
MDGLLALMVLRSVGVVRGFVAGFGSRPRTGAEELAAACAAKQARGSNGPFNLRFKIGYC